MKDKIAILSLNSLTHTLVDAACAALVVNVARSGDTLIGAFSVVLLYDLLAFATQPLLGLAADRHFDAARVAAVGCVMTAAGLLLSPIPVLAICAVGIGNALFHVGGGIVSLRIHPGKAWAPGVFVAPGDIGLVAGTLLGRNGYNEWIFIAALVLAGAVVVKAGVPERNPSYEAIGRNRLGSAGLIELVAALIMVAVFIRSFAGMAMVYPWKKELHLLLILAVCVSSGKAFGGFLADRFGWLKVPIIGLLLSIPLLSLGFKTPAAGLVGLFMFNLTMPVTLAVLANLFPKYQGFAFGLTVIALSLGTVPVFAGVRLDNEIGVAITVLISVITLFVGLSIYDRVFKNEVWEA